MRKLIDDSVRERKSTMENSDSKEFPHTVPADVEIAAGNYGRKTTVCGHRIKEVPRYL